MWIISSCRFFKVNINFPINIGNILRSFKYYITIYTLHFNHEVLHILTIVLVQLSSAFTVFNSIYRRYPIILTCVNYRTSIILKSHIQEIDFIIRCGIVNSIDNVVSTPVLDCNLFIRSIVKTFFRVRSYG